MSIRGPWFLLSTCLCLGPFALCAEEPGEPPAPEQDAALAAKVEKSIRNACNWMAKNQNKDGSLKSSYAVAATGLAGLSWLAAGSTPHEGPYAVNIRRGLEYILKSQGRGGFISESAGYGNSSMYGHGFSTQFLAQACGMVRDEEQARRIREALAKATACIEATQNQFGGWNSTPDARQSDDGSGAVAIMQIAALRAAESCGIHVKTQTVEKAKKYLLDMTNKNGWYAYNWHSRNEGEGEGRAGTTGPGIYMLGAMNLHENPKYEKGIRNLMNTCPFLKGRVGVGRDTGQWYWFYYTCFYASLAVYQHGGAEWSKWYPAMVKTLTERQRPDGSFEDEFGGVYTGLGVLSLAISYRYLPMFQEGGAGREGR